MRRAWLWCILLLASAGGLRAQYMCSFQVSATSLSFGTVYLGATSTMSVRVTNISGITLNFTATVTGTGFSGGGSFSLMYGSPPAPVPVTFAPPSEGTFSGNLHIVASGSECSSTAQDVSLSGTGRLAFTVSPTSLSMGNVLLGCATSQTFTITPATSLTFNLSTSPPGGPLTVTSPLSPFTISSPTNVTVTFTPAAAGAALGLFVNLNAALASTGQPVQPQILPVSGTGVDIVPSPATLDFGSVSVGTTSAPKSTTLTPNPPVSAFYQVSTKSSSAAFAVSSISSTGVAQITFTPSAQGPASGTITFTITDPSNPSCLGLTKNVQVTGVGIAPVLTLSPTSLDFGIVQTGTTSAPKTVTLTNSSTTAFTGTVSSSNPMFVISPASFSVGASSSQTFNVTFAPTATGPQTATITFSLSSTGLVTAAFTTTLTLSATGQGQAPPAISVSPATIDFGNVNIGSSGTNTVVVSNTGGAAASVTGSTASPFSLSTASFTVNAGGTQSVTITFTPASAGPFQGTATFSAGSSSTQTVMLKGTGVTPPMPVLTFAFGSTLPSTQVSAGGSIAFAATAVGSSNSTQFQIGNTGTGPATISGINSGSAGFSVSGLPSLPATVPAGGSLPPFTITFTPATPGAATGTLNINSQSFTLTGTGLVSGVTITGTGSALQPAQQSNIGIMLARSYPGTTITGQLIVTFSPNAAGPPDEPAIQFATSGTCTGFSGPPGRCVTFSIAGGSTSAVFPGGANQIGLQDGSVAGNVTLQATFSVGGVNVSPPASSANPLVTPVNRAAPVIQSITASRSGNTVSVVMILFATSREVNTLALQLTGAAGANLLTTSLSLDVASAFSSYFTDATRSGQFGGMAKLTVPLTISGDPAALASLSATLSNGNGTSPAMSTNVQ